MKFDSNSHIDTDQVSIIMPCYNAESTLEKSVQGVLSQTYINWELLLIVDGSIDGTATIAAALAKKDSRIRLMVSTKNRGVSRCRNLGIRLSKGSWIAFCDADDWWMESKLNQQLNAASNLGANLVCSAFYFINSESGKMKEVQTKSQIDYRTLLKTNAIPMSTAVFRLNKNRRPYFPVMPKPYIHEDYAFWLLLFQRGSISAVYLKTPTTYIAQVLGSRSANKILSMKSHGYILKTVAGVNRFVWPFLMLSYLWNAVGKRING
jgi:glycosyltransferase involved in cell wall biosynthesis